jgi:hypothetical protein
MCHSPFVCIHGSYNDMIIKRHLSLSHLSIKHSSNFPFVHKTSRSHRNVELCYFQNTCSSEFQNGRYWRLRNAHYTPLHGPLRRPYRRGVLVFSRKQHSQKLPEKIFLQKNRLGDLGLRSSLTFGPCFACQWFPNGAPSAYQVFHHGPYLIFPVRIKTVFFLV